MARPRVQVVFGLILIIIMVCSSPWARPRSTTYAIRVAIPEFYDKRTQRELAEKSRRAIEEASRVFSQKLGVRFSLDGIVRWRATQDELDVNHLRGSFPYREGQKMRVTVGIKKTSLAAARDEGGHAVPFHPWIVLGITQDTPKAHEALSVRQDAFLFLHEFSHMLGAPHVKAGSKQGQFLMNPELRSVLDPQRGTLESASSYVNSGRASGLHLTPLTKAVIQIGIAADFSKGCELYAKKDLLSYIGALDKMSSHISPDEAGDDPAGLTLRKGLLVYYHNTAMAFIESGQARKAESCVPFLNVVESRIGKGLKKSSATCIRKILIGEDYNALVKNHTRLVTQYNDAKDPSKIQALSKSINNLESDMALKQKEYDALRCSP